ncbi:isochorismatase family cysteine hydrolase [Gluconacetobacter asukensis]|uniref:Cysteine hydrolase n=1 Tax=Gluconacetobacter asukensis TaxID=1017181 RepID=A0A7W4IZ95_9PROT|nr:isochorismatase family cysteine hydrolase [Gluconacetobacter asukensis]MBB2171745.1 cysteine hydrolase [Gluconacetobacter asukensis]
MPDDLRYGALGANCVHLCVDMQRLFAEETDRYMPWMKRVCPTVERIAAHAPERTIFTRFIPASHPGEGEGTWRRYYRRWASMTLERIGMGMVELVPELRRFVPPAEMVDKHVYSPWMRTDLQSRLVRRGTDTLIISGGETDICVLATVLGAIDRGYRVVIAIDALCSSSDSAHDASLRVYHTRYGQQVETAAADEILAAWS